MDGWMDGCLKGGNYFQIYLITNSKQNQENCNSCTNQNKLQIQKVNIFHAPWPEPLGWGNPRCYLSLRLQLSRVQTGRISNNIVFCFLTSHYYWEFSALTLSDRFFRSSSSFFNLKTIGWPFLWLDLLSKDLTFVTPSLFYSTYSVASNRIPINRKFRVTTEIGSTFFGY
jgi:hypothetical protein